MKDVLTPKQVARAIGVSEASLKRWCDKGHIPFARTPGGHRRLPISGVIQFLRETGQPIVRPEVLGLPSTTGLGETVIDRSVEGLVRALELGDEEQARTICFDLYLAGHSALDICDRVVAPTFHHLGERWQHGDIEVYQERLGCEITLRILYELRVFLRTPDRDAPHALGGTLIQDPYAIPTTMVEVVLHEAGWRAQSMGTGHPVETLCAAIDDKKPRLFWLSISTADSAEALVDDGNELYRCAAEKKAALVLGGRALNDDVRKRINYSAFCDHLQHLIAFAKTLYTAPEIQDSPSHTHPNAGRS